MTKQPFPLPLYVLGDLQVINLDLIVSIDKTQWTNMIADSGCYIAFPINVIGGIKNIVWCKCVLPNFNNQDPNYKAKTEDVENKVNEWREELLKAWGDRVGKNGTNNSENSAG